MRLVIKLVIKLREFFDLEKINLNIYVTTSLRGIIRLARHRVHLKFSQVHSLMRLHLPTQRAKGTLSQRVKSEPTHEATNPAPYGAFEFAFQDWLCTTRRYVSPFHP